MQKKLHIKTGDTVKVLSGNERGNEGVVLSVDRSKFRAIVEGLNMVSKHLKPSASNPQGGIEKREAGINISNLQVVVNGTAQRVGRKDVDGKLVRFGKKTGETL
jgi:large subunit ribosomal protein L24|tara:strand:- start:13741 stop:14052 length:312 start_codon:yes stop_codon:yes gene_type:complete